MLVISYRARNSVYLYSAVEPAAWSSETLYVEAIPLELGYLFFMEWKYLQNLFQLHFSKMFLFLLRNASVAPGPSS